MMHLYFPIENKKYYVDSSEIRITQTNCNITTFVYREFKDNNLVYDGSPNKIYFKLNKQHTIIDFVKNLITGQIIIFKNCDNQNYYFKIKITDYHANQNLNEIGINLYLIKKISLKEKLEMFII